MKTRHCWHQKSLGLGSTVYMRLRRLNELRHEHCPSVEKPYLLAIDTLSTETWVMFPPEQAALARAFGASPCAQPNIDGNRLVDLEYQPLPVTEESCQVFRLGTDSRPLSGLFQHQFPHP